MKKILLVSCTQFFGGGESFLVGLSNFLADTFEIHALVSSRELYDKLSFSKKLVIGEQSVLKTICFINQYIRSEKIDIIILNGNRPIYFSSFIKGKKIAYKHTGSFSVNGVGKKLLYSIMINFSFLFCSKIICVSHAIANDHKLWRRKIKIIYNGVDVSKYNRLLKEPIGGQICFVGRLVKEKGIWDAIFAILEISKSYRVHFTIVGSGDLEDEIRRYIHRNDIKNISLLGHLSEPITVLRHAEILLFPSYYESFGLAVCEAMAMAIPVVTSNAGGLSEIVRDGIDGYLVEPGDIKAIVEAMEKLLKDKTLSINMGNRASARVLKSFSDKCTYRGIKDLLLEQ